MFFLSVIPAVFAFASTPNVSQPSDVSQTYKSSACSDETLGGFNVVICDFGDKAILNWPPAYLNTRNISNPYDANCYIKNFEYDATVYMCDYGDVEVYHWPEKYWPLGDEKSDSVLSTTVAGEPKTPEETTDRVLFKTPLDKFIARRENRDPPYLIWESDGCTHAPDNPMGFNFLPACQRHDFGYRNYRAQNRLSKSAKKKINKQFKVDLHGICHKHIVRRAACRIAAKLFYEAVKHNSLPGEASTQLD